MVWILQQRSEAVLGLAGKVVVKLISVIPDAVLQSYLLDLIHPLSSLLSSLQLEVSISCAAALGMIFSNSIVKREKRVWETLVEAEIVSHLTNNLREFSCGTMPIECFQEMASLLSIILHQWPESRYSVWNDVKLMEALHLMLVTSDFPVKVMILKLYSRIALCAYGAKKLLEKGEALLQLIVLCMGRSHPPTSRIEAFRLARYLVKNEQGCSNMMSVSCQPLVGAIIEGLNGRTLHSQNLYHDQMSLLVEVCRLALIICWAGKHHDYFWKQGITKVLLDLIVENDHNGPSQHFSSLEEQISRAQDILNAKFLIALRPYVWEILGWLATYCSEDCNPRIHGHENCINILVTCACLSCANSIRQVRQVCQADAADTFSNESALKAVLLMIYSPCKYIASKAKLILSEILKPTGKEYLKHLLHVLNITSSRDTLAMTDTVQTAINLVALTCFSGLPQYQSLIVKGGAIKILIAFVRQYLSNNVHMGRLSLASHLHDTSERMCCWVNEDWEGDNDLLFYCLWSLAQVLHSRSAVNILDTFDGEVDYTECEFLTMLQEICTGTSAPGSRWYAAYILSYFGIYGFPCKLGKRVGKVLGESKYADFRFILTGGESVDVHGVILAIRCPSLLPPEKLSLNERVCDVSLSSNDLGNQGEEPRKEICLSSHVDKEALMKLLEFVYMGYLQASEEIVRRLKLLAKHCSLQPLVMMLGGRSPKWGKPFPSYDFSLALTPRGQSFSDIILEAKATESICWTCSICSLSVPHVHAHKAVLYSSCDYLRALFQSGMQESQSQIIKVPASWEAMTKLVKWFYTDELPNPPSGCLWNNMDSKTKLSVLQPYLELCWLSDFWFLKEVHNISYKVALSCLDSAKDLSIKIIKIAADFSLWKLAEVAAHYLAPSYRQLYHSGDLEELDEVLVDMIRTASVKLSQQGH